MRNRTKMKGKVAWFNSRYLRVTASGPLPACLARAKFDRLRRKAFTLLVSLLPVAAYGGNREEEGSLAAVVASLSN